MNKPKHQKTGPGPTNTITDRLREIKRNSRGKIWEIKERELIISMELGYSHVEIAEKIGDGDISEGIRIALEAYLKGNRVSDHPKESSLVLVKTDDKGEPT